jgi:hypothetical protein
MRKDRILIEKSLIPYSFMIPLNDITYILEIRYNAECDLFTIGLYDRDETLICIEPIIYGAELFKPQYQARIYPAMRIVPLDDSGNTDVVTWDNMNEKVFLTIENAG